MFKDFVFKSLTSKIVSFLTLDQVFVKWLREEIILTLQAYDKATVQLYQSKITGLSGSSPGQSEEVPRTIGFHT